jgi:hypothetical protein
MTLVAVGLFLGGGLGVHGLGACGLGACGLGACGLSGGANNEVGVSGAVLMCGDVNALKGKLWRLAKPCAAKV